MVLVSLNACTTTITDKTLYLDQGPSGAVKVDFFSSATTQLTLDEWNAVRTGMACMSPPDFASFKTEIEQLCTVASCDEQTNTKIKAFFSRFEENVLK